MLANATHVQVKDVLLPLKSRVDVGFDVGVRDVLPFGEPERFVPIIMLEVDLSLVSSLHCVEPIVKDDVVLMGDLS